MVVGEFEANGLSSDERLSSGDFINTLRFRFLSTVPYSHPYLITCLQNGEGFGLPVKIVLLFPLL